MGKKTKLVITAEIKSAEIMPIGKLETLLYRIREEAKDFPHVKIKVKIT